MAGRSLMWAPKHGGRPIFSTSLKSKLQQM